MCIRANYSSEQQTPTHIYAHRACAAERDELPLYSFIDGTGSAPAAAG